MAILVSLDFPPLFFADAKVEQTPIDRITIQDKQGPASTIESLNDDQKIVVIGTS